MTSDTKRYAGKARCDARPIRLDLLEQIVWTELMRLLEDPTLIQAELNRRLAAAHNANPAKRREETLTRELVQANKRMERLLTAYQEELLSLDQLRRRMPELRRRAQSLQTELDALRMQVADQSAYLRLAQTLSTFLERLHANVQKLDARDRQRITRLLIKEVVVSKDTITIRHSIPNALRSSGGDNGPVNVPGSTKGAMSDTNYLLCPWRAVATAGQYPAAPTRPRAGT